MSELIQQLFLLLSTETDPVKQSEYIVQLRRQGVANTEIARRMEKTPSQVSHIARINKLPEMVLDAYYSRMLSVTHLYILSRLHFESHMKSIFEQVMAKDLSTQETDRLVREKMHDVTDAGEYLDPDMIRAHIAMMQVRGLQVKVIQTRTRVKYVVEAKGNVAHTSTLLEEIMHAQEHYEPKEETLSESLPENPDEVDS